MGEMDDQENKHGLRVHAATTAISSTTFSNITNAVQPTPAPRRPLQPRTQNVALARTSTSSPAHATVKPRRPPIPKPLHPASRPSPNLMAPEKTTAHRPFLPTLSGPAKAAAQRSPLTPRVAASAQSPATRRGPVQPRGDGHGGGGGGSSNISNGGITQPSTPSCREDVATPIASFLTQNVTPRSGSRRSRVDGSANTTPVRTPSSTPAPDDGASSVGTCSVVGEGAPPLQKRATVSFAPSTVDSEFTFSLKDDAGGASKFFFASEARAGSQAARPTRPQMPKKAATFFYANGSAMPGSVRSPTQSASASSTSGDARAPIRVFHADRASEVSSPIRPAATRSSTASTVSRMSPAPPSLRSPISTPRAPSPSKLQDLAESSRDNVAVASHPPTRPPNVDRGAAHTSYLKSQSTNETPQGTSHKRAASSDSPDTGSTPTKRSTGGILSLSPALTNSIVRTSVIPMVASPDELPPTSDRMGSGLTSPTKPAQNLHDMQELAANARRERKVLDLEITNSSLTAINRSLEREMRKQAAELRRYRRLSRSGRLSFATNISSRNVSGMSQLTSTSTDTAGLTDVHEDEDSDDSGTASSGFVSSDDDDSADDDEDGNLSPTTIAANDARHRQKDERRLQLDLSKHQQLLIDSQKLNQSLRRCLGWTEELISEGKKALEYRVRVSDVKLGGRVLVCDDDDDDDNDDHDVAGQGNSTKLGGDGEMIATESHRLPSTGEDKDVAGNETMSEAEIDPPIEEAATRDFEQRSERRPPAQTAGPITAAPLERSYPHR